MASSLVLASNVRVPRFFTLEFNENSSYATYVHDGGEMDGCIRFEEIDVVSPYTKFEAEAAGNDGLFHIRSCENNRYWERNTIQNKGWITATAEKKEGDQTKASSTLFKFITVDAFLKTVRILHVQSGNYLCLSVTDQPTTDRCTSADYNVGDPEGRDILQLIDRSSLLILPRYVAFKGFNGMYLRLRPQDSNWNYLEFSAGELADPDVPFEVFATRGGTLRIKSLSNNRFWIRIPNWIWGDSVDNTSNNNDTLFRPFRVNDTTIGLLNLGNNHFCRRFTAEGKTSCLHASLTSLTSEAQLTVEEPIMEREIYDVQYQLSKARVYNETVIVLAREHDTNRGTEPSTINMRFSFTETETSTWQTVFSLKLEMKTSVRFAIPLIANGKVEISKQFESVTEWGKTTTRTSVTEFGHRVPVPPKTKKTVHAIATRGTCDVPFTYMQKDTLYNGRTVITKVEGNTFTGSNYYSMGYETTEEKLE